MELAPQDKNATEVNVFVTEVAQVLNVDLTDVERLVEIVLPDKVAFQENVLELAHHNVFEQTEPLELVDGTDVEVVVVHAQQVTDAETEPVNATPTVTTNIVEMTVVEVHVEPAKEEPFVKEPLTLILNNVTSTVTLKSELKSENSRQTSLFKRVAELMLLDH